MVAFFYALVTSVATIVGGLLPFLPIVKRIDFRYLVAFASGAMISIAIFGMMREIGPDNVFALGIGFFSIYLIEKLVLIHMCGEAECESHTVGGVAMVGVAMESLIDGIAIAGGYALAPGLGLMIAMAVFIHELPRGLTTTVIMKASNYRWGIIALALAIDSGFTPLGAAIAPLFPRELFQNILAFAAGTFLYVGASDLLPEAHKVFNLRIVLLVLVGAGIVPFLELITGM